MVEALIGTVSVGGGFLAIALWCRAVYASFKAAANRKPGVRFGTALNNINLIFRDSLYTQEGLRWATTFGRCMLGFVVIGVLEAVLAAVLKATGVDP